MLGTRIQFINCLAILYTYITGNQVEKTTARKIQTLKSIFESKQRNVVVLIVYDRIKNPSKEKKN